MSYESVVEQVKSIPEKYLPEVSDFLSYVQYKSKMMADEQVKKDIKIFEEMQTEMSNSNPWTSEEEMISEISASRKNRLRA